MEWLRRLVLIAVLILAPTGRTWATDGTADGPADGPVASAAAISVEGGRTRFVLDLSSPVSVSAFPLAGPDRIVIDLPEVRFVLPPGTGRTGAGTIRAWRYGQFAPGRARIVMDVAGPVTVEKAFVAPPADGMPARLVIDLVSVSRAAFDKEVAAGRVRRRDADAAAAEAETGVAASAPSAAPAPSGVAPAQSARPVIVIDPGHGGIDPGASGPDGALEKVVVLEFGRALASRLAASGRFDVVLTRDDDVFLSLSRRVEIARDRRADLFISIHADSAPEDFVRGATVYTLSDAASDREAALIAAHENKSDAIAGLEGAPPPDAVTDILLDLVRRETRTFSAHFAQAAVTELTDTVKLNKNPQRAAGFHVLRAHDVPSVLIELGYMSNADDEALLTSKKWRDHTADALSKAVTAYFAPRLAAGKAP